MQQTESQQNGVQQIVVFKLGAEEYGLSISQIKEVVITPAITRMPQTPTYLRGVANIRGTVIAMVDLEEKFGIGSTTPSLESRINYTLVINSNDYKMGVLVKDVPNTLSIAMENVEKISTGENDGGISYITGVVKLDKRLIILIDIFKVINEKEAQVILKAEV